MKSDTIPAQDLAAALAAGAVLIDVRSPAEFSAVHVRGARNVPLHRFDPEALLASCPGEAPIHLICQSGSRACTAAERLAEHGCTRLLVVEGGTEACIAAGLPVQRGRPGLSMQRQVQLVVGTTLLLASALAFWHHPAWLVLTAAMGAGLSVAGATGTCGLALLLARMPWNQRMAGAGASCASPQPSESA